MYLNCIACWCFAFVQLLYDVFPVPPLTFLWHLAKRLMSSCQQKKSSWKRSKDCERQKYRSSKGQKWNQHSLETVTLLIGVGQQTGHPNQTRLGLYLEAAFMWAASHQFVAWNSWLISHLHNVLSQQRTPRQKSVCTSLHSAHVRWHHLQLRYRTRRVLVSSISCGSCFLLKLEDQVWLNADFG